MSTTTLEAPSAVSPPKGLTGHDRCDACGAQAWFSAMSATGSVLLFCAHHGRKFEAGLVGAGFKVNDESSRINVAASLSSA